MQCVSTSNELLVIKAISLVFSNLTTGIYIFYPLSSFSPMDPTIDLTSADDADLEYSADAEAFDGKNTSNLLTKG